jgi:hypothetical protein
MHVDMAWIVPKRQGFEIGGYMPDNVIDRPGGSGKVSATRRRK